MLVFSTRATSPRRYARLAMLIDRLMPEFDAMRIEHRVVAGRVSDAYATALGIDFVDPVRQSRVMRAQLAVVEREAARSTTRSVT